VAEIDPTISHVVAHHQSLKCRDIGENRVLAIFYQQPHERIQKL
jgi:hypothetical protein